MIAARFVLVGVVGYLLGSIPFGIIVSRRMSGVDVRQHGSGKMGTTNVLRTAAALKRQGRSVRAICLDFHSTGGDKVTYRNWLKGLAIDLTGHRGRGLRRPR